MSYTSIVKHINTLISIVFWIKTFILEEEKGENFWE